MGLFDLIKKSAKISNYGLVGLTAHRWTQQYRRYLKGQHTADDRLNGIQVNRSNYGMPVPLVYGRTRIPISLAWYGGFTPIPHKEKQSGGGKGGAMGGGSTNTTYTYQAAVVALLCEGQITEVSTVWADNDVHTSLSDLGLTLFNGAQGQAVWSYLTTNYPAQAVPYDMTAYLAAGALDLGSSASMPNLTCEVKALLNDPAHGYDAPASSVLIDYCTNPLHGCGFNYLDLSGISGGGATTFDTYCFAMGFFISPQEMQQRPAVDFIRDLLEITNSEAVWSPGKLRIVPYADASVTGNSRTYTPDLTPIYTFDDDDYCPRPGEDPVIMSRTPTAQTYNKVRVEYLDRNIAYNTNVEEASDDRDIRIRGERVMPTVTLHQITVSSVARQVAQLILQKQLYIKNVFRFRVRADYSLLEPMDLVAINDSNLGVVNQLVRIVQVEDSENDEFTITAEEMLVGTASAPRYDNQLAAGYAANFSSAPGSVTTPLIIQAPPQLVDVNGGYEIWIGAAGATPAAWGGCEVYASLDNVTFTFVGTMYGPAKYGTLRAALAAGSDPDSSNTLAVNLLDPTLVIDPATTADADNLRTLTYVDGEVLSYRDATLVGAGQYNLGYLRRGKYGSSPAVHNIGSSWMRLDDGVFRMRYDPGMIGQTLYFKFPSFNVYGKAKQDIATLPSYSKVLTATNAGQLTPGAATFIARGDCVLVGDQIFKKGTSDNWDSDVYSLEAYTACSLSFRPTSTNCHFMMGLNSDPTTDQSYISLDHAMFMTNTGAIQIWENNVNVANPGTYTTSSALSIVYDGQWVRYYAGTTVIWQTFNPGKVFFFDSSFCNHGASVSDVRFAPLADSTPSGYRARGFCRVTETSVSKQGGAVDRGSDFFSIVGLPTCHFIWKMTPPGGGPTTQFDPVVGLSINPVSSTSYGNIQYGFDIFYSGGTTAFWQILESGTTVGVTGTWDTSTEFAITYDGTTIHYYVNRVIVRSVTDAGKVFFAKGSLQFPYNDGLNSLRFGPTTNLKAVDTVEIGQNAATEFGSTSSASGSMNSASFSGPPTVVDNTVLTLSYTNTSAETRTVEVFAVMRYTISGSGAGWICAPRVIGTLLDQGGSYATSATDQLYSFNGQVAVAPGATATFTLAGEYKTAGSGSSGLVLSWANANLKYNVLKR